MGAQTPEVVSPKLLRIAEVARERPGMAFMSLAHLIDVDHLREAHRRVRKDGAAGIDNVTAEEYGQKLEPNLVALHDRLRSGSYRAPPVLRTWIPKASGGQRPIGIPTFEDKIVQRAVAMVLEAVYEQDFLSCSYGFRPGRSAHQAILMVRETIMSMRGAWIVDADIRSFFDSIDHAVVRELLGTRIQDGSLRRLIGKWLKAGVMEDGELSRSSVGTPQGGVISPLLANVVLHYVLDVWFEEEVRPRLRGGSAVVRYADDFVMLFEFEEDAKRVLEVLPKRLERFALHLHPEKTRLVSFCRPALPPGSARGSSFDFLGFTFFWSRSRKGNWVTKWKTAKDSLRSFLVTMNQRLKAWMHLPLETQSHQINRSLIGFFRYAGIEFNVPTLSSVLYEVRVRWRRALSRRCRQHMTWVRFERLLERFPLPPARRYVQLLPAAT